MHSRRSAAAAIAAAAAAGVALPQQYPSLGKAREGRKKGVGPKEGQAVEAGWVRIQSCAVVVVYP